MKNNFSSSSCYDKSQCELPIRTPLQVLQIYPSNKICLNMSTSRKSGALSKVASDSRVPLQNKSRNLIHARETSSLQVSSDSAFKNSLRPKAKICDKVTEPSKSLAIKTNIDSTPSEKKSRSDSPDSSLKKVKSLTSSPKWARIKDKFEKPQNCENSLLNTDAAAKEKASVNHLPCSNSTLLKSSSASKVPQLNSEVESKNSVKSKSESFTPSAKTSVSKPVSKQNCASANNRTLKKNDFSISKKNSAMRPSKSTVASCFDKTESDLKSVKSQSATTTESKILPSSASSNTKKVSNLPKASTSIKSKSIENKNSSSESLSSTKLSKDNCTLKNSKSISQNSLIKSSHLDFSKVEKKITCEISNNATVNNKKRFSDIKTIDTELNETAVSGKKLTSLNAKDSPLSSVSKSAFNAHLDTKNKSAWVKSCSGNWMKTADGKSNINNTEDNSKVALLRQKFNSLASDNEKPADSASSSKNSMLFKSTTVTNVPCKLEVNRPIEKLYRSNTVNMTNVNSLDNKTSTNRNSLGDNIMRTRNTSDSVENTQSVRSSVSSYSTSSDDSAKSVSSSEDRSPEKVRKLSLVQRAVLSYEENLSLLSPETQRKLKLLGEKVKAQTDDDKLFIAKSRNIFSYTLGEKPVNKENENCISCSDSTIKKQSDSNCKLNSTKIADPVQPVRSFLTRYQNMYKTVSDGKTSNSVNGKNSDKKYMQINSNSVNPVNCLKSDINIERDDSNYQNFNKTENSTRDTKAPLLQPTLMSQLKNKKCSSLNQKLLSNKVPKSHIDDSLQPNSSFLWRNSGMTDKEIFKVGSQGNSDQHNYYVLENYYSPLEFESVESHSPESAGHNACPSQSLKLMAGETRYKNIHNGLYPQEKKDVDETWTDLSDEELYSDAIDAEEVTYISSTVKKKNKRLSQSKGQTKYSLSQISHDPTNNLEMIKSTNSKNSDNSEKSADSNHYYEPVYESLGNYLINSDDKDSGSLSDEKADDFIHSSYSSLDSIQSDKIIDNSSKLPEQDNTVDAAPGGLSKKAGDKIRQLKRHLSWTKSDIRLELSSKFNKIKIKKNMHNSTEIGVKVQENDTASTSPKKNTFIKCILKQKSANVPAKILPSPKKESALFYVHLSMGHEKQRPFSDSCVEDISNCMSENEQQTKTRKISEPTLKITHMQTTRIKKRSSGQILRPKTPPPLPPAHFVPKNSKANNFQLQENESFLRPEINKENSLYTECKNTLNNEKNHVPSVSENTSSKLNKDGSIEKSTVNQPVTESEFSFDSPYSVIDFSSSSDVFSRQGTRNSIASSGSLESYIPADESGSSGASSSTYSSGVMIQICESSSQQKCKRTASGASDMSLTFAQNFTTEHLKSPFEEEPLYQFYHKDVQQRATLWYSADGSESEFEDYPVCKVSHTDSDLTVKPLQSQMSAMDLVHGEGGQRTLWCEVPEVRNSGILNKIDIQDRKIQEAMFEVITSEASYLKSLNFLLEHFAQCPEFSGEYTEKHVLDKRERHILFSDVPPVRDVSASLLADLEKRWLENVVLSNVCDIIYEHASKYFSVYVKYCSNQIYQDRTLKQLKETRPHFVEVLKRLESNPVCQGLDMQSFLMLPMQRITRLPLLVDAIFHRLDIDSPIYESCKMALAILNKLVTECNEGARKMERMEEMLVISHQLDFKECKGFGLLSASRWLVKKGELVRLLPDASNKRTFGRNIRWCKMKIFLFLFTDLLVVTRKKSDDTYSVMDYCPRNMVQVMPVDENTPALPSRLPSNYRNIFQMIMLHNHEGKTVEMLLSCLLESDRTRWMDAVTPAKSENPDEKIYEEWDCPQVQCTYAYCAQQPDELSIEEADVVNVFRKMADGWYEGERIRDGVRGWFPSSHTVEIISSHIRARNLRQRYRLLMLSQSYLEQQQKTQVMKGKGK